MQCFKKTLMVSNQEFYTQPNLQANKCEGRITFSDMPHILDINKKNSYFPCTLFQETTGKCAPLKQESWTSSSRTQMYDHTEHPGSYPPALLSPTFLISLMAWALMSSPSWETKSSIHFHFSKLIMKS